MPWIKEQIHIPDEDYDEDDEIDLQIEKARRAKRDRIDRGRGLFGI